MKIAIMQPYFLPYLGYFQLMAAVDQFVLYDNIEFTKKGWIHRNRYLKNGSDEMFTVPLKKDSDYLDIKQRFLAENYITENTKTLRKLEASYKKSPFFEEIFPHVKTVLLFEGQSNLFEYIFNSIIHYKNLLGINTEILISSHIEEDNRSLKGKDRVINICKSLGCHTYINPIGGVSLYDKAEFKQEGISLNFHRILPIDYKQFEHEFIPHLSIIDLLMFNGIERTKQLLTRYELI